MPLLVHSFFANFNPKSNQVQTLKKEILDLSRQLNRGLDGKPEDRSKLLDLFEKLEAKNSKKSTLGQPSLADGLWNLEYTTSDDILGKGSFPRLGGILQKIDTVNLKAENREVLDVFGFKLSRKITADLTPLSPSMVAVQFKVFTIGPINFNAPAQFKSTLDITYVDEDLRLTRGAKGNIFVLTRILE